MVLKKHLQTNRKGFSLLVLLITLIIIGILFCLMTSRKPQPQEQKTIIQEAGIDTTNYKTLIDSAQKITEDAVKKMEQNQYP